MSDTGGPPPRPAPAFSGVRMLQRRRLVTPARRQTLLFSNAGAADVEGLVCRAAVPKYMQVAEGGC